MRKEYFKKQIKKNIQDSSLKELIEVQSGLIKVNAIVYHEFATQKYIKSSLFSNAENKLLFALRSHCVRGITANFLSLHKNNMSCALACGNTTQINDQQHILQCIHIIMKLNSSDLKTTQDIKITDI